MRMEDGSKNTGIAVATISAIGLVVVALIQFNPSCERAKEPDASGLAAPVDGKLREVEEVAKDIVRKSQVLEFLTIYTEPTTFDDVKLAEALDPLYIPAKQGGRAAQQVIDMVGELRKSGRHYSKTDSRLVSMEFDSVAVSGIDALSVKTRENWYLPYYQGNKLLPRRAEVATAVTYNLRKIGGKWKIESTTTPLIQAK